MMDDSLSELADCCQLLLNEGNRMLVIWENEEFDWESLCDVEGTYFFKEISITITVYSTIIEFLITSDIHFVSSLFLSFLLSFSSCFSQFQTQYPLH